MIAVTLCRLCEGTAHHAALIGDTNMMRAIIASSSVSSAIRAKDAYGATPLHIAAFSGSHKVASLVLKEIGVLDTNTVAEVDQDGNAAIHLAVMAGHDSVIDTFAEHGCDLDIANHADMSAIQIAVSQQNMVAASLLVSHGANVDRQNRSGWSSLHLASAGTDCDVLQMWLSLGSNSNAVVGLGEDGIKHRASGHPPLLLAARAPPDVAQAMMTVLLDAGADANFTDEHGHSALKQTLELDNTDAARFLVARGAEYSALGDDLVPDGSPLAAEFAKARAEFQAAVKRKEAIRLSMERSRFAVLASRIVVAVGRIGRPQHRFQH